MKKHVITSLAFLAAFLVAVAYADEQRNKDEAALDIDIVMSDMPLSIQKADLEGEHQANDLGPVLILLVPYCDGTAI